MAANHTALRVERQDLFEDQLRASNTRSVRRASGLVLVGQPEDPETGFEEIFWQRAAISGTHFSETDFWPE